MANFGTILLYLFHLIKLNLSLLYNYILPLSVCFERLLVNLGSLRVDDLSLPTRRRLCRALRVGLCVGPISMNARTSHKYSSSGNRVPRGRQ